jgi:ribose transport system permease protein
MNQEPVVDEYRDRATTLAWIRDLAPLISLLAIVVFFLIASPNFRQLGTITSVLQQAAALSIVAVGLTYVLICGEIDLAVGNLAVWTACSCAWLFTRDGVAGPDGANSCSPWLIAAVIALPLLSTVLLGVVSGTLTIWSRLPSFIITLAMMNIALGMSKYLTGNQTLKIPAVLGKLGNSSIPLLKSGLSLPYSMLLAAGVLAVGHVVLQHTRFGRYVYMTGGNREAARLAGVRTGAITVACLALCAFTAGTGGLVNAGRLQSASVLQNANLLLSAVACVVLGGTSLFGGEGGIGRTIVGVTTFCVLEVGLQRITWIHEDARLLLTGSVLMTALVINGLLAKRNT